MSNPKTLIFAAAAVTALLLSPASARALDVGVSTDTAVSTDAVAADVNADVNADVKADTPAARRRPRRAGET